MGNLRSVGGRGEVDLDNAQSPPKTTSSTSANSIDPTISPTSRRPPHRTVRPNTTSPAKGSLPQQRAGRTHPKPTRPSGRAMRTSTAGLRTALPDRPAPSPRPSRTPLASPVTPETRRQTTLPRRTSRAAGVPGEEATVPPVTSSRSRLRRSGPRSRPLGRLARPAAVIGALTLSAGGTAIAINAATVGTPHARAQISTSNAALTAGPGNRASGALSATIGAVTSELRALARAVPPARSTSHRPHKPRRHRPSHKVGTSNHRHPATVSQQNTTSPQTSPPPQTYNSTPASVTSSSTSQATAGSQTRAISTSQPAFGQNGTLGPGRGAPGTQ